MKAVLAIFCEAGMCSDKNLGAHINGTASMEEMRRTAKLRSEYFRRLRLPFRVTFAAKIDNESSRGVYEVPGNHQGV